MFTWVILSYSYFKHTCDQRGTVYKGNTKLELVCRCAQHMVISHRTGRHISKPPHSAIRTHSEIIDNTQKFAQILLF